MYVTLQFKCKMFTQTNKKFGQNTQPLPSSPHILQICSDNESDIVLPSLSYWGELKKLKTQIQN